MARHDGRVTRVAGGDPSGSEVAAPTSLLAVDRAGVGQGRMTGEAGNSGGGKDPDFWCVIVRSLIAGSMSTPRGLVSAGCAAIEFPKYK
jgi:hypothetical protein